MDYHEIIELAQIACYFLGFVFQGIINIFTPNV